MKGNPTERRSPRLEMAERLEARRWLVDELRIITPPQHFMTRTMLLEQQRAVDLLLGESPANPLQVYVHVPFCEEHCKFCMYFDKGGKEGGPGVAEYCRQLGALIRDLELNLGDRKIHALYVGGGTASILTSEQIADLFSGLGPRLHEKAEATFEMSPKSSSPEKMAVLRQVGFNRLSFGLQSFNEALLAHMRRAPVGPRRLGELLDCARTVGFADINVDLMVGLENEGPRDLLDSAETLFRLRPPSVSVYRESRPDSSRTDLKKGLEAFLLETVAPRVAETARLAGRLGYRVPNDLMSEHVRFRDATWNWQSRPSQCLYATRCRPDSPTTLVGLGPSAFSFCGGALYAVNQSIQERRGNGRDLTRVYFAGPKEQGASIAVNLLYQARSVEKDMFRAAAGADIDELFNPELEFLEHRKLIRRSDAAVHRTCQNPSEWAYNDKLLYPERWVQLTRKKGF